MGLEALSPSKGSTQPGTIARLVVRFLQFVLGLTVAGLYGTDLAAAAKLKAKMDMDWLYAVTVAGLSCLTTIIYFIPRVKSYKLFWWDFVMTVLWAALTGRFATMYLHPKKPADAKSPLPKGAAGPDPTRMHNAVYVDAVSLVLWGATWLYSTFLWWKQRRELKKAAMSGMP